MTPGTVVRRKGEGGRWRVLRTYPCPMPGKYSHGDHAEIVREHKGDFTGIYTVPLHELTVARSLRPTKKRPSPVAQG